MVRDASFLKRLSRLGGVRCSAAVCVLQCACASAEVPEPAESGCTSGPQCETSEPNKNKQKYDASVSLPAASDASATERDPSCGDEADPCDPDDVSACSAAPKGGSDAQTSGSDARIAMSCQVQATPAGQQAVCAPAGTGISGDPCVSGENCAAGFTCVEAAGTAQCRRYCCNDPESCEAGTYCTKRTLRLDANAALSPVAVPVCVKAVACPPLEPYPCPEGTTCQCPAGTACTVVRADGTTDWLAPAEGVEGDGCPCAAGYVCSQGTDTCLKICNLRLDEPQCSDGLCQSSKSLPDGYGLCVGDTAGAG